MPLLPPYITPFSINTPSTYAIYTLSLHDALPISKLDATTFWQANTPDLVVINLGVNDRRFSLDQFNASYDHFLSLVTTLFPSIPILPMIPFSQTFAESIRSLTKKHKLPLIENQGWCSSFTDDLHPDQYRDNVSVYRLSEKLSNRLK